MKYSIDQLEHDLALHMERLAKMRKAKGNDYSGSSPDTLANLRPCGMLGIVVRISDKFMRLKSHYLDGKPMHNESIEDTWDDLINYAFYGRIYHDQNKKDVKICACDVNPPDIQLKPKVVPWESPSYGNAESIMDMPELEGEKDEL